MKEIKFRGKTKEGKWVYGNIYRISQKLNPFIMLFDRCGESIEIIPETVGQYIGLKDRNGREIYEGDIFKFNDEVWESCYTSCGTEYNSFEVVNYGVIGFEEDFASYGFSNYKFNENSVEADLHENHNIVFADFLSDLEVIGNIHDSPELIKQEG